MSRRGHEAAVPPVLSAAAQGGIAKIIIGPDKKVFEVHKALMCHHSEYFRTAYNGKWKEADEGFTIEDVESEVFSIFVHWLYTQQLPSDGTDLFNITTASIDNHPNISKSGEIFLVKACVFGDRFLAPRFRRDAHNDYINKKFMATPWYEHINYAFTHLPEDALLLEFMVDKQCLEWSPEADEDYPDDVAFLKLLNEFLVRVMRRKHELQILRVKRFNACWFHIHDDEVRRNDCEYSQDGLSESESDA